MSGKKNLWKQHTIATATAAEKVSGGKGKGGRVLVTRRYLSLVVPQQACLALPSGTNGTFFAKRKICHTYGCRCPRVYLGTTTNCSNNSRSIRWKRKRWSWWQEECFTRRHRWLPRPKRDCNFRVSPRLFRYVKSSSEWNRGVMFSLFHSMKLEFYVWIWASLAVHPALYNMIFTHSRLNDSIWQVLDSIRFLKDGGSIDYK